MLVLVQQLEIGFGSGLLPGAGPGQKPSGRTKNKELGSSERLPHRQAMNTCFWTAASLLPFFMRHTSLPVGGPVLLAVTPMFHPIELLLPLLLLV